jgi:putative ABC transport system substrate-binding protein
VIFDIGGFPPEADQPQAEPIGDQDMTKVFRTAIQWLRSDNLKSKTCTERRRSIENPKWAGLFIIVVALTVCGARAEAQQPKKVPRIGFLANTGPDAPNIEPFRKGLRDLGYIEGNNIQIEYRYVDAPDHIPNLVKELLQLKVDVFISGTSPAIRIAKQETSTIPIVMVIQQDPVDLKLVDSFARPNGNVTGVTLLTRDLSGKRLELLKEAVPGVSRVGVLWATPSAPGRTGFQEYEAAAQTLKIPLLSLEVRSSNPDFEGSFQAATKARVNSLITVRTGGFFKYTKRIAELAIKNRLPSMHEGSDFVDGGGLMSYAASYGEAYRRAAVYVDKILKGAKPADLPVEQPTKFDFVINLKTAKQIGLTIPPNVLARADRVIR